ncbi:MAG TPA: 3,4-dihydroxy-2-butanone-4-phosphate synthase [Thermoplasmata archaeon]|nr:3,4-dihydroxy-2-butanone-4-phosphate synthase [Thermoplasmata archaeon]HEV2428640.1 3,4-dihydroxy-2-butanone-4-phosphate synthase [Thermoplasmata archaeon]
MQSVLAPRALPDEVGSAARSLSNGEPILVYDAVDREGETDLMFLSDRATPDLVRLARRDAGGLICTAVSDGFRRRVDLPFFSELLEASARDHPVLRGLGTQRLRYDARSAFGVTINHRTNFTGVPDNDRATTIRVLGELVRDAASMGDGVLRARFVEEFSSPGHLPLLYAAPELLRERKGHTELAVSLARMASLPESVTVCEMLGDSGGARSPEAARRYADDHGWPFLEGRTITEAFRRWSA